jgi:hypothetical protein
MKKFTLWLFLIILSAVKSTGENLVPNNSFETRDIGVLGDKPDVEDLVNKLRDWKIAGKSTPDWFSTRTNFLAPYPGGYIQPASGTEYVGISPCEGIEVRLQKGTLNTSLDRGKFYKLSFWFCARNVSTQLRAYLRSERVADDDIHGIGYAGVEPPYYNQIPIIPSLTIDIDINTDPNVPGHFTPGTWYLFESNPIYIRSNEIKWLAIAGRSDGDPGTLSQEMVFIDEVGLNELTICDLPCISMESLAPPLVSVEFPLSTSFNNVTEGQSPFVLVVTNAVAIELIIYAPGTGNDNIDFHYFSIDPQGLNNIDDPNNLYPPTFRFEWWGDTYNYDNQRNKTNNDLTQIQSGFLHYEYIIHGCPYVIESEYPPNSVNYQGNDDASFQYEGSTTPELPIDNFNNCCRTCRYISNTTENGQRNFRASQGIYIGNNTNLFNSGPVTFDSQSSIKLIAGEEIIIEGEFQTVEGSNVIGELTDCPYQQTSFWQRIGEQSKDTIKEDKDINILIYPNPANEILNLSFGRNDIDIHKVLIFDIAGRLVLTPQLYKAKDSYSISLAGIPSGMYSCSILLDGNIINKSFVKL